MLRDFGHVWHSINIIFDRGGKQYNLIVIARTPAQLYFVPGYIKYRDCYSKIKYTFKRFKLKKKKIIDIIPYV